MPQEQLLNNQNFLNGLFTEKDFDFFKIYDKDIKNFDIQIETQRNKREFLVQLINNLNDTVPKLTGSELEIAKLLFVNASTIFNLSNQNISLLYNLENYLKEIHTKIVNLLVSSENNYNVQNDYIKIKELLEDYSSKYNEAKNVILLNDMKIDKFINSAEYKSYISIYGTSSNMVYSAADVSKNKTARTPGKTYDLSYINNNKSLRVSEKEKKVYLPYTVSEIKAYLEQYPKQYKSPESVIKKEFILPLDYYMKHPVIARFRETYSLIRDREGKSVIEALKLSMDNMFKYSLNPIIIAACKTQSQLESYLHCLEINRLDSFTDFEINFEINPI